MHEKKPPSGPPLYDPVEAPDHGAWTPADEPTRRLLACVQACRDIVRLEAVFAAKSGEDRRALGLMATHVVGLADAIKKLRPAVDRLDRSSWDEKDRTNFVQWGRDLARDANGPLRQVRNSRSAHYDADKILDKSVPAPSFDLVLPPLCTALGLLILILNHDCFRQWTRAPADADPSIADVAFGGLASRFKLDGRGGVSALVGVSVTPDPRHRALDDVLSAVRVYNALAERAGPTHGQIEVRQRAERPA